MNGALAATLRLEVTSPFLFPWRLAPYGYLVTNALSLVQAPGFAVLIPSLSRFIMDSSFRIINTELQRLDLQINSHSSHVKTLKASFSTLRL
jgi:hypothetical protein